MYATELMTGQRPPKSWLFANNDFAMRQHHEFSFFFHADFGIRFSCACVAWSFVGFVQAFLHHIQREFPPHFHENSIRLSSFNFQSLFSPTEIDNQQMQSKRMPKSAWKKSWNWTRWIFHGKSLFAKMGAADPSSTLYIYCIYHYMILLCLL